MTCFCDNDDDDNGDGDDDADVPSGFLTYSMMDGY